MLAAEERAAAETTHEASMSKEAGTKGEAAVTTHRKEDGINVTA
jgi:hypothetical protein